MIEGDPAAGVMASGQVAALINKVQSCQEVIEGIINQARERRDALLALSADGGSHV